MVVEKFAGLAGILGSPWPDLLAGMPVIVACPAGFSATGFAGEAPMEGSPVAAGLPARGGSFGAADTEDTGAGAADTDAGAADTGAADTGAGAAATGAGAADSFEPNPSAPDN